MVTQYILEAKFLDKINRVKKSTIVGVFRDLASIESVKRKITSEEKKYRVIFSITSNYDPFLK